MTRIELTRDHTDKAEKNQNGILAIGYPAMTNLLVKGITASLRMESAKEIQQIFRENQPISVNKLDCNCHVMPGES